MHKRKQEVKIVVSLVKTGKSLHSVCSHLNSTRKFWVALLFTNLSTHCRLNEPPNTIDWKILILILEMSGYVI